MLEQGERRRLARAAEKDLAALAKRQATLNRRQNTRTDAGLALKADTTSLDALGVRVGITEADVAALQAADVAHGGRLDAVEAALPLKAATADVDAALALKADASALAAKLEWTTAPASAAATGTAGQIAYESGFLYLCVATDTWQRVAVATWP